MDKYQFRRDNGEVIEVSFGVAQKAVCGYLTLDSGEVVKRIAGCGRIVADSGERKRVGREHVSDSLGFVQTQLSDFEDDRKKNGFHGIEFTRDPAVPQFIQVRCSNPDELARYAAHRGQGSGGSGTLGSSGCITQDQLDRAAALVTR